MASAQDVAELLGAEAYETATWWVLTAVTGVSFVVALSLAHARNGHSLAFALGLFIVVVALAGFIIHMWAAVVLLKVAPGTVRLARLAAQTGAELPQSRATRWARRAGENALPAQFVIAVAVALAATRL